MSLAIVEKLTTLSEKNLAAIEKAKEAGRKAVGLYCLYAPVELVVAAGAIPLPLCGTRNDPIADAEKTLPRNLCPLIKSSFGFAVTDTCPFFHFSDFLIAETTCDGKKKMFELLKDYRPLHVMQLPQNQDPESSLPFWIDQVRLLKERIEAELGVAITDEKLSSAIGLMNRERLALKELMDLPRHKPSPVSGMEMLTIKFRLGFFSDKETVWSLIREATQEIRGKALRGESPFTEKTPRLLLTGTPVGLGCDKILRLIEECGANVVVMENCSGYKKFFTVSENGDPLRAIAEQYLRIPCSCMSPNPGRIDLLNQLIEEFQIDGVVDLTWQACHTYNVESHLVRQLVEDRHGLPFLQIETDYSESDTERLRVRIEAFLELME